LETLKDQFAHGATQEADNRTLDLYHSASRQSYQLIGSALIENKHLESLRDWLLTMLMNGQAQSKNRQLNYHFSIHYFLLLNL
jgi:hypothetical protein